MARREPIIPPQCDIMIPVTVTFYGDVGFDRSYNHVIDFSNETERDNYFSSRILKTVQNCAYNKPMNSIQLKCSYTEALNFTYCKFVIGSNVNSSKKVYAWVDDVVLITDQKDENDTFVPIIQINISIDPWQTFLFDFTIGESFVAREHVDRFKANLDGTTGWTLGNTSNRTNIGIEKRKTKLVSLMEKHNFYEEYVGGTAPTYDNDKIYFMCVQATQSGGTNIRLLFIPIGEKGYCVGNENIHGRTLPIDTVYRGSYLAALGIGSDFVSNVAYIPFDIYNYEGIVVRTVGSDTYNVAKISLKFDGFSINVAQSQDTGDFVYFERSVVQSLENDKIPMIYDLDIITISTGLTKPINNVYSKNHEPQLYKQPYRYVSIVDSNGAEKGCLPDIMANYPNQSFTLKFYLLIDSVDVRLRIVPRLPDNTEMDSVYWIEFSLPYIDIVSTHWLNYMLQQRDADRALIQSQINQGAIASAVGGVSNSVSAGGQQTLSAIRGELTSPTMVGGAFAAVGLGASAIQTIGSYLTDSYFCFEQQDIREKAIQRKANNVISPGTFKSMIDSSINIYLMECDETSLEIKAKEFHKYGYSVFFYETPNLKSRKYFNFIATSLCKIEGSLNNEIKMALTQVFNNGVTIWHGDYINELTGIGDYSKENIERSLIT